MEVQLVPHVPSVTNFLAADKEVGGSSLMLIQKEQSARGPTEQFFSILNLRHKLQIVSYSELLHINQCCRKDVSR